MKIQKVEIKNFRILRDVHLSLEDETTVIVGRNNSGKTCFTELLKRFLSDTSARFTLEDFSISAHEDFWKAYQLRVAEAPEPDIREVLPIIEVRITFNYDTTSASLGPLGAFVINLDSGSHDAVALISYRLQDGGIDELFKDLKCAEEKDSVKQKKLFFREIRDRISSRYVTTVKAIDPADLTNEKSLELSDLRSVLMTGFIHAQRGLDDSTQKEKDLLGKILQRLLGAASSEEADATDKATVEALRTAVQGIQEKLDSDFSRQADKLLPALSIFGYPGLGDPNIQTETSLDVERLLGDNTKIRYATAEGISLPETYNGLGSRNLIYILFQILEFFKAYKALPTAPSIHLVFIEEPEAHLHPQMQEVFIRKIHEIAREFEKEFNAGKKWPVQFVITTHSTHIANESSFESIRYFLSSRSGGVAQTEIKDLRNGITDAAWAAEKEFLHKYITLTKCDLFFADKAILIEGATERLLLPTMISKTDVGITSGHKLSSQYVSIIEVGGAYAHIFFRLLDFLQLKTLTITDIDSVNGAGGAKCEVSVGTHTSNTTIKKWFADTSISPTVLKGKSAGDKTSHYRRLAYQIPENSSTACGRSFEDAFILANQSLIPLTGTTDLEKEKDAYDKAQNIDKTTFAFQWAITNTTWTTPRYIADGLLWLAENPVAAALPAAPIASAPPPKKTTVKKAKS